MRKEKAIIKMVLNMRRDSNTNGELIIQCELANEIRSIPLSIFNTPNEIGPYYETVIKKEEWDVENQKVIGYWDDNLNKLITGDEKAMEYCAYFEDLIEMGLSIVGDDYILVDSNELDIEAVNQDMKSRNGKYWDNERGIMNALKNGNSDKIGH
ncbi:hypothetical protein [Euzebyella saccharophila]|uniref:Uncharacterized protein n=1 Tax=Euzebyella saccharophila TaxID=679664 RepID=A0ABV8JJ79_9FLAO|nr:hypothetical protein [Euzebyella saccharophila]